MDEDILALLIPISAIVMSLSIPIVYAIVDYRRARPAGPAGRRD